MPLRAGSAASARPGSAGEEAVDHAAASPAPAGQPADRSQQPSWPLVLQRQDSLFAAQSPNSAASASPGSAARMNASPTRKACTPASRMRCTSAAAEDAGLGDQQAVRPARPCSRPSVVSQRDLEGAQVAVVDADQRRLELQRALAARRASCTSTSTAMSRLRAIGLELGHLRVVQAGGDQQDAVGAHRARFVDLVGIDHEVLAQHRQVARGARLLQVVGLPWKNCRSVSTDRQAAPCSA